MADKELNLGEHEERRISDAEKEIARRTVRRPDSPGAGSKSTSKPPSFISRLFGRSTRPTQSQSSDLPDKESSGQFRVNLADGAMHGSELYEKGSVSSGLNKQLKGAGLRSASTRKEVKDMIMSKRSRGLNKQELKQGLRDMRKEGKISRVQERNLRKDLGVGKRPGFF